ncbi:MAG: permease [Candidatus Wallbacteria bacterium]|nr:permease [Candidatus Wallbacteria bacterium]
MEFLVSLVGAGLSAVWENLVGKLSGAFIPAFFIAGGVGVFVPKSTVVRFLSPAANRGLAYVVASVAGAVLSVCSCGIIPLFAAFYEQGAGLGPAVTFLFAGPSINLISMFYGFYLLGPRLGLSVIASVLLTSILLGMTFELAFARGRPAPKPPKEPLLGAAPRSSLAVFHFFLFQLLMTLPLPVAEIPWSIKVPWVAANFAGLMVTLKLHFTRQDVEAWVAKSTFLIYRLLPKILVGLFLLGMLTHAQSTAPQSFGWFRSAVGDSSLRATLLASAVGAVLYLGSIMAVLTVKALMAMGMAGGPALAFVVAAPGVSFSTLFAVAEVIGMRLSLAYYGLVIVFAALAGYVAALVGLV